MNGFQQWAPMMASMVMMKEMISTIMHPNASPSTAQPSPPITSHSHHSRKTSLSVIPSSDDFPDLALDVDYPLLSEWLSSLDAHPTRGRDQLAYVQWTNPLRLEGFLRLNDIHGLSCTEMQEVCEGMKKGMAARILGFAREDVKALESKCRHASKRARQE